MEESEQKTQPPGRKLTLFGLLAIWIGSIGLTLEIKNLLTPGSIPADIDPSFNISLVAFCILLCLLGALIAWRGVLESDRRLEETKRRVLNIATMAVTVLLSLAFILTALTFSANNAFARQYQPVVLDRPRPDYSLPDFPTPAVPQPTPTFDPQAKYFAGPITSAMDGLRVGNVWVSMAPTGQSIYSIQVYMERIECSFQGAGSVTTHAVDASQQVIGGPIQIQEDGTFFGGQATAVVHGAVASSNEVHGTLYLRYVDPASQQACDLGNFDWDATVTHQNR